MAQVVSRELIDRKADIAVAAMTINFARYQYTDIIRAANEPSANISQESPYLGLFLAYY